MTHVINLDMPLNAEYYLHRAGRTGRMGRSGTVISIVAPKERFILDKFRKALRISIDEKEMYEGRVVDAGQGPRSGFRGAPRRDDAGGGAARVPGAARSASGAEAGARRGEASGTGGERSSADRRGESGRSGAPAGTGRGSAGTAARRGAAEGRGGAARGGSARQPASRKAARKQETAQDRKNKGAPKWLKAKRDGDGK